MRIDNLSREHMFLLFFILFIFALTMTPSLAPALFLKEGYAWTTLNTFNYVPPDLYYYASGIKEVITGNVLIKSLDGQFSCETARVMPYWFASIPFLFFNFNLAIPLSISLCVITTYSLMYLIY